MRRILLLGGTTEASHMARMLAQAGEAAIFSYAGRTGSPVPQPLAMRIGGFGGTRGLVTFLRDEKITHVIDATHPFAARMSLNALAACAQSGVALATLERPAWMPVTGDDWHMVPDIAAAAEALPNAPSRVFLAIGKQNLEAFTAHSGHHYLLRLVDPTDHIPLPGATAVFARGPFSEAGDLALLQTHHIDTVVAKNSGGAGAQAKIDAARQLGLRVIMIARPELPARMVFATPAEVMAWLGHADLGV